MTGVEFSDIKGEYTPVDPIHDKKPAAALDLRALFGTWLEDDGLKFDEWPSYIHELPARIVNRNGWNRDSLCKARASTIVMMTDIVYDAMQKDPSCFLMFKIGNSIWRNQLATVGWNETVAVHDGIVKLGGVMRDRLGDDFGVTLDYTTSVNPYGYSEHARIFLDGVFALLVHYRGEHVMTISFSILRDYTVAIQQVQCVGMGNRWLYRLKKPRLVLTIDAFREAFPQHTIALVDGSDNVERSLAAYQRGLDRGNTEMRAKIDHLNSNRDRIIAFYSDIGDYRLGKCIETRHAKFREVLI